MLRFPDTAHSVTARAIVASRVKRGAIPELPSASGATTAAQAKTAVAACSVIGRDGGGVIRLRMSREVRLTKNVADVSDRGFTIVQ